MQRQTWSPGVTGARIGALLAVVLLVAGAAAGSAAAAPRLFVSGGTLESGSTLVGDDFDVSVTVKNTGDSGGALNIDIRQNGSTVTTRRVVVDADSQKTITETVQFDQPGRYVISAENREIGTVSAKRVESAVVDRRRGSRTVSVRAGAIPTGEPYTVEYPVAANQSFGVEQWTVESPESQFTQDVTEYTDPNASGVEIPSSESASVVGLLTVDSTTRMESATMRLSVNRSTLRAAGLGLDDATIYHLNESAGSWEPLETTVAEERTDKVVYEATATEFSTFALGSIEPSYSVQGTALSTVETADGQRIVLEGTVRNDGAVEGDYTAEMLVNGEAVDETTVTIPAGEERTVELSHEVTESGTYEVDLNDRDAGSVVLSESDVSSTATDGEGSESDGTATPTAVAPGDGPGLLPSGVPATVMGISTLYLAGGIALALVLFFGIVGLLRRGGSGGNGGSGGGFEQL